MYWIFLVNALFVLAIQKVNACSCVPRRTTDQEYLNSELVVKGRIVGSDTVSILHDLYFDRRGVKVGKHKYSIREERFLKITFVVDLNFKSATTLPDTIYILTAADPNACGYPFPPYFNYSNIPVQFYEYIIYGDRWLANSINKVKRNKKVIDEINRVLSDNTFETSICRRTQSANENELSQLNKVRK